MKRNIYLKKKTLEEAKNVALELAQLIHLETETISAAVSSGRVTAEPVFARISSPPFHCAAMDGIAVRAETTIGASEESPKRLRIGEEAVFVNTGNPVPAGMDAVIMIEDVHVLEPDFVEIREAAYPWQHVRAMGEDMIATEMVLQGNHRITPYDIGALLASGNYEVKVWKRPRVLIIPTGSELIDPFSPKDRSPNPSGIIESNSYVLSGLIAEDGGEPIRHSTVKDNPDDIQRVLAENYGTVDMVLIIAGSSAGTEDYTRWIIEKTGNVLVHGISIMPGKPTLLGTWRHRPVVGIPGYPVSAIIAYEELVRAMIHRALGLRNPQRQRIGVFLTRKTASKLGTEEFLRVKLGKVGGRIIATPLPRGSGVITSLTKADGIIRIPSLSEGLYENEQTEAELLRPLQEIEDTVVMVGSHDLTLDILSNMLGKLYPPVFLSSQHVGSLGGIIAIRNGYCHLAGSHLLDPETGRYNFPYVRRYLQGIDVRVVHLVERQQGLIIKKGNPKNITGLNDLTREGISFINRQKGSGTRVLLDHLLKNLSIDPRKIMGYEKEEFTHMAVASCVASGMVDAGLGILSAAAALDLDFVPVATERYDLVIPSVYFDDPRIQKLLATVRSAEFKDAVLRMGGYDVSRTGEEIFEFVDDTEAR